MSTPAADVSLLARLVGTVSVACGGLVVVGCGESELAGAVDVPVLGRLVGTVDVGAAEVGSIDVAPTDETGTTEFSWTAVDDALS